MANEPASRSTYLMIHLSFALRRVLHLHPGICDFDADGLVCRIADRKGGLKPATKGGERKERRISKAGFRSEYGFRSEHSCPVLTSVAAYSAEGLFETIGIRLAHRSTASSTRTSCRPLKLKPYIVNATCSKDGPKRGRH